MEPIPNNVYISLFFSAVKQELMWIFPTAIVNLLCRAVSWDGRDVREGKKKRSSCLCATRKKKKKKKKKKKQCRPVKGRGRGETGDKEQMRAHRNRFVRTTMKET